MMRVGDKYQYLSDAYLRSAYLQNKIDYSLFYGAVLYLGMGDLFIPSRQSGRVTRTTIVEIDPEVIDRQGKIGRIRPEWEIINEDASRFVPKELYDIIFIDIWYQQTESGIIETLKKKYEKWCRPEGRVLYLPRIVKNEGTQ